MIKGAGCRLTVDEFFPVKIFRKTPLRFPLDHSKSAPPLNKSFTDGLVAEW